MDLGWSGLHRFHGRQKNRRCARPKRTSAFTLLRDQRRPGDHGFGSGVLEVPPERVLLKGRLQPGRMFLIDTEEGRIVADEELKKDISTAHPYRHGSTRT